MWEFNQSLRYDKRMHAEDIQGSIAYAKALKLASVLTANEEKKIVDGLRQVGEEWKSGKVRARAIQAQKHATKVTCSSKLSLKMRIFTLQMKGGSRNFAALLAESYTQDVLGTIKLRLI